jgi:hypothetical protein
VSEFVGVCRDSTKGSRENAGETVSYPSVDAVIGIRFPITGESVKPPDVVADVGIPFDDTANSPLGRILGSKVILIPDGTPVGEFADPGGPDNFSGFDSMDGNTFKVGPCVGISFTEIGVETTGLTTGAVGCTSDDTTGVVVMGDIVPVIDVVVVAFNDGFTDTDVVVGLDERFGEGLLDGVASIEGVIDSDGIWVGKVYALVLFWKTNAAIDPIFVMRPSSTNSSMIPLKTSTNWAAPLCTGAAPAAQKHVSLLTTNPSSRRL